MGHRRKLQQIGSVKTKANLLILKNRIKSFGKSVDVEFDSARLNEKDILLEKTEQFFNVGRWTYNFKDEAMNWSPETYKIFEYQDDYNGTLFDFFKSCIDEIKFPKDSQSKEYFNSDGIDKVINHPITTPKGSKKLISFSTTPVYNKLDEITAVEGFVMDITHRVLGDKGLDNFFNLSHDLHCITHMNGYFLKVSPSWIDLLGFSEKELLSQSFLDLVHPDDVDKTLKVMEELISTGTTTKFENRYVKKSGEIIYLRWNCNIDPETNLAYSNAINITQNKLAREEILSELSSKDLLLREIHHRVKNNLQIISSILSLQATVNDEEVYIRKLYQDSQNRIQSMASIHEMFYQSKNMNKIEFGPYVNKLIEDLSRSLSTEANSFSFSLDADPVFVNLDTAIPLGLLINELITNSIKHGSDAKGNVRIFVSIKFDKQDRINLFISDTGINSKQDVLKEDDENESLGVLLINSLVEQIDGEIEQLISDTGTAFKLSFRNVKGFKS